MQKTLAAIALSLTLTAVASPAFAMGPASLARDLMYTSAIGRSPEVPLMTHAGFVRPGVPLVLRSPAAVEGEGEINAHSKSLAVAIDYVISKAVDAVQAVTFLR